VLQTPPSAVETVEQLDSVVNRRHDRCVTEREPPARFVIGALSHVESDIVTVEEA
jgi:hypothetical protein